MNTFPELLDKLKQEDQNTLLEILNLETEELIEALEDIIHKKQDVFREYYEEI